MSKPLHKNNPPKHGDKIAFSADAVKKYGDPSNGHKVGDVVTVNSTRRRTPFDAGYTVRLLEGRALYGYEWFETVEEPALKVGDRVIASSSNPDFDGKIGTITVAMSDRNRVDFDHLGHLPEDHYDRNAGTWSDRALTRAFEEETKPAKPAKILASLTHETSRTYANKARSPKALIREHNTILAAAASGDEVDVVAFRKAATAALSLAATRAGQSVARREYTRQARHLIYWADAIIDNHIAGLPVYEGGPRSPRIAELEAEVEKLRTEGSDEVIEILAAAKRTVEQSTEALESEREHVDSLNSTISEITEQFNAAMKKVAEAEHQRDHWASVVFYVGTKIPEAATIALAYSDGLEDA